MPLVTKVAHPSRLRGAKAHAGGDRDGLASYGEDAWPGGGIARTAPLLRTGFAVGRLALAVLAPQAWLEYTRPLGWPKQKVEVGSGEKKLKHCIWMFK